MKKETAWDEARRQPEFGSEEDHCEKRVDMPSKPPRENWDLSGATEMEVSQLKCVIPF